MLLLLLLSFLLLFFKKTELVEKTGTAKSLLWKETPQSPPQPQRPCSESQSSLSHLPRDGQGEPGGETANSPRPVWPLTKGPHVDGPSRHSPRVQPGREDRGGEGGTGHPRVSLTGLGRAAGQETRQTPRWTHAGHAAKVTASHRLCSPQAWGPRDGDLPEKRRKHSLCFL